MKLEPGLHYTPLQTLPHRDEMLLLDRIDGYGPDWVRASVIIGADDSFFEPGFGVPAWVGLEYMAQTIGVYSGIERLQHGREPTIAMLVGARHYSSDAEVFREGEHLTITARLVLHDDSEGDDLVVFTCELARGDAVLARAEIKAFRPRDLQAFLQQLIQGAAI